MTLFKKENNDKLKQIKTKRLSEKELQTIVEKNLDTLFNLKLVESEYNLHNFRIDTLAFDKSTNSFVIIEYKENQSYSVMDQGFSYLNLLLSHKGDFQLTLERKFGGRVNVDFSQSRIIFIAKSFSNYQQSASGFKDTPIELWKYSIYEGDIISFEQIKPSVVGASIKALKSGMVQKVSRHLKSYNLEHHLEVKNEKIKQLYYKFREEILKLDNQINEKIKKHYIAFELNKNFVEFVVQASALKIYLDIDLKDLNDKQKIAEDCVKVGHWATGNVRFKVRSMEEIPYAMTLIKQSYEANL